MKPFLVRVWSSIRGAALELFRDWKAVGSYLLEPETHVFGFSIAANVLLAFYPFLLVMLSISEHILHSTPAIRAIYLSVSDYFPGGTGVTIVRNLETSRLEIRHFEWISVVLLLLIANGVFLPLEVALNRAWGVAKSRNLLMNQLVSTGTDLYVRHPGPVLGVDYGLWPCDVGASLRDCIRNALAALAWRFQAGVAAHHRC